MACDINVRALGISIGPPTESENFHQTTSLFQDDFMSAVMFSSYTVMVRSTSEDCTLVDEGSQQNIWRCINPLAGALFFISPEHTRKGS